MNYYSGVVKELNAIIVEMFYTHHNSHDVSIYEETRACNVSRLAKARRQNSHFNSFIIRTRKDTRASGS